MSSDNTKSNLIDLLSNLDEPGVLDLVRRRLHQGDDPLTLLEECQEGMNQVGMRFEQQEYYLSGLMMAGEIFREVMEIVEPVLEKRIKGNESGHILLGTIQGDIHDIGKNTFGIMMRCYGFTVTDLGVDVQPAEIIETARRLRPDIIGLSSLLTMSFDFMKKTVSLLRQDRDEQLAKTPVIIGGGLLNSQVCSYVAADYWTVDAMVGVKLCQEIVPSKNNLV
jgi:methanogenic corrinoid protein MtbC1